VTYPISFITIIFNPGCTEAVIETTDQDRRKLYSSTNERSWGIILGMPESQIAPGFLVAAPQMQDPHFERSVIFMIEHQNDEGSLGLIINRKAQVDLSAVVNEMNVSRPIKFDIDQQPPILYGGPVSPERGWIIHTPDWSGPQTQAIGEEMSVTSSLDILDAIFDKTGPKKYRFCLGYAGWGPSQLVGEIKHGAWINVPFSVDLIFDVPLEQIWSSTLSRLGIDPNKLVGAIGDA
jgi:putative transcriptional regulator